MSDRKAATYRINVDTHDTVTAYAAASDVSANSVVNEALELWLDTNEDTVKAALDAALERHKKVMRRL